MSDSLKDQLLKAGFKSTEPAQKKKSPKRKFVANKNRSGSSNGSQNSQSNAAAAQAAAKNDAKKQEAKKQAEAIEQRKAAKAKIKILIEAHRIEKHQGDIAHSYALGTRIKQIFVNETVRKGIVDGELVITRLNGDTYVVPTPIGDQILAINPEWVVVKPVEENVDENDEYAEFKVPDDLQW